jgi:hypothetical protein
MNRDPFTMIAATITGDELLRASVDADRRAAAALKARQRTARPSIRIAISDPQEAANDSGT